MGSIGSDPIMLDLFRAELDQHLPVLSEGLLALEKGRATRQVIESMMRAAHSIKGAGRVMGVDPVVAVAHALEDCFTAAKDARITLTPDAVDVLLAGVDCIQRLCSPDPGDAAEETVLAALLARITAVGAGPTAHPPAHSAVQPAAQPPAHPGDSGLQPRPSEDPRTERPAPPLGHTPTSTPAPAFRQGSADQFEAAAEPTPPQGGTPEAEAILLPADLGGEGAEWLRRHLLERLGRSGASRTGFGTRLRLDFSNVERLGPEALAVLLSLDPERSTASTDAKITACGVGAGVRALFRVTGLDSVLAIVD